MSLDASIKAGYAPGGLYYNNIKAAYGAGAADEAYRVSLTASDRSEITTALNKYRAQYADPGSTSTLGNFFTQITTDPLAAPLEGANNLIGNSVFSFLKNPWVLLTVAFVVWWKLGFPGAPALRKKFA